MKRNRNRIMAGVLGVVLMAAWLWTGKKEISEEDRTIYEEALLLQEQVEKLGFADFRLMDYPVAMYDGTFDYVFYEGEVKRRAPVLETFAGTACPVEDHFEVIIPTLDQFDSLLSLAGGAESMAAGSGYGPEQQKASIWHEAFHAYQMTEYGILGEKVTAKEMCRELEEEDETGPSEEERIVKEIDEREEIRNGLTEEMRLLAEAAEKSKEVGIDELKRMVLEYKRCRRERQKEMSEEAIEAEIRCELTEGTAYYVEASVYRFLCGEQAYRERYLENLDVFGGGRGKYYRTGLAKCLILERLSPGWKDGFDFSKGLDELIDECGEEMYIGS